MDDDTGARGTGGADALMARLRSGEALSRRMRLSLVARLSIPAILAQLSTTVMQYIDASMVGALGATQAAAVGLMSSSVWLASWIATSASVGFTVQVAQLVGARRDREARAVLLQAAVSCAAVGLALAAVSLLAAPALPDWLGGSDAVRGDALAYFLVLAAGLPVTALQALVVGSLQASGDMRLPGLTNVLACALDAILDVILIYPSGTAPLPWGLGARCPGLGLGMGGAAFATILSLLLSCLPGAWVLLCRNPALRLRAGDRLRMSARTIATAARVSIPVAVENSVFAGPSS